jgi:hypothetical protein
MQRLAALDLGPSVLHYGNAPDMLQWLRENLAQAIPIALDHDLGASRIRDNQRFDPGIGRDVAAFLAERTQAAGLSPGLLIYDTVAQCMNGADENMPAVVAPILKRAKLAAARFGTTMFVHHAAQGSASPARAGPATG